MHPTQEVSPGDALAITSLSAEFGHLVDHGRATECEALFTADSRLVFGPGTPKPGTLAGLEAIRAFLTARQAQTHVTTRHVASNFRAVRLEGGDLELRSLITVFRSDDESRQPSIGTVADIFEIFRRDPDGSWKILERVTIPIFVKS